MEHEPVSTHRTKPMRILLLAPEPFYIDRGTPIDVDILVRALVDAGHSIDLVCYPEGEERTYPGVTIHRVKAPSFLFGTRPGFTWKKMAKDLLMVPRVFRLVRRYEYDVVHAGEEAVFLAMLLRRVFGLSYVYDMDSSIAQQMVEQYSYLSSVRRVLDWMESLAIRGSLATGPVCNALAELARDRGAAFVETLHDISQLEDPAPEPTGFLRKDRQIVGPILMYVGNLQPYQGIDLLLESFVIVFRRGVDLDLVIAGGSQADIQKYQKRAVELGISARTHFLGPWPNDRLEVLLAEADILTAPRVKGVNTPMKIFPYLHTGKPVLVTDLTTHNQILDSSVAFLAPDEPHAFAAAIEDLVKDEQLRATLGRKGREFVERNHTYPAHRARVDRLYGHVAERLACRGRSRASNADAELDVEPR